MNRYKITQTLSKFYLRYNRGSSLASFITSAIKDVIYFGIVVDLSYRYFQIEIPYWLAIPLVIAAIICYYVIGYFDELYGFWKHQNSYQNKELTPFFKDLDEKLNRILGEATNEERVVLSGEEKVEIFEPTAIEIEAMEMVIEENKKKGQDTKLKDL